MSISVSERLESLESCVLAFRNDLSAIRKHLADELGKVSPELSKNSSFMALLQSYIVLRQNVNDIVLCIPSGELEESHPLSRLQIVEIETRVQLLRAHILRILAETDTTKRDELIATGIKSQFEFMPDIAKSFLDLSLVAGHERGEGGEALGRLIENSFEQCKELSLEITKSFDKTNIDDTLMVKTNLKN